MANEWWTSEPEDAFWERQKRKFAEYVQQRLTQPLPLPDVPALARSVAESLPRLPAPRLPDMPTPEPRAGGGGRGGTFGTRREPVPGGGGRAGTFTPEPPETRLPVGTRFEGRVAPPEPRRTLPQQVERAQAIARGAFEFVAPPEEARQRAAELRRQADEARRRGDIETLRRVMQEEVALMFEYPDIPGAAPVAGTARRVGGRVAREAAEQAGRAAQEAAEQVVQRVGGKVAREAAEEAGRAVERALPEITPEMVDRAERARGLWARKLTDIPTHPEYLARRANAEAILVQAGGDGDLYMAAADVRAARKFLSELYGGPERSPEWIPVIEDAEREVRRALEATLARGERPPGLNEVLRMFPDIEASVAQSSGRGQAPLRGPAPSSPTVPTGPAPRELPPEVTPRAQAPETPAVPQAPEVGAAEVRAPGEAVAPSQPRGTIAPDQPPALPAGPEQPRPGVPDILPERREQTERFARELAGRPPTLPAETPPAPRALPPGETPPAPAAQPPTTPPTPPPAVTAEQDVARRLRARIDELQASGLPRADARARAFEELRPETPDWLARHVEPEDVLPPPAPAEPPASIGGVPPRLPSGRVPGGPGRQGPPRRPGAPGGAAAGGPPPPTTPARSTALAQPSPPLSERLNQAVGFLLRQTYDRLYPLRELDRLAGLEPTRGSHAVAQVVSGAFAAGEDIVRREVLPVLNRVRNNVEDLEWYMVLRSYEDTLARNPHAVGPGKGLAGWQDQIREMQALQAQLGPERFQEIEAAADELWQLNDKLRLRPLLDEGLISPEQYRNIKSSNPHYVPFDRHDYQIDDVSHLLPAAHRPEASVSGPGIQRRVLAGSEQALDEPLARWVADIINTQTVISRNRAARGIVEALQLAEQRTGRRLVQIAPEAQAQRSGLTDRTRDRGYITFYDPKNPGQKMVASLPRVYEIAAKGLEAAPAGALANFLKVIGAAPVLRAGATTLNVAFLPVNIIRDISNAALREGLKVTPLHPNYWRGLAAAIAKNTDFSEAARAGVLSSGLLESMRAQDVLKSARRFRRRGALQVQNAKDALLLFPRLVREVGETIRAGAEVTEQAPRIATFLKLKAEGLSDLEAAVRARDVTVDFSKSGDFVRVLNQITPFLNARIQGGANTVRAIRDNPRRLLTVGAPFVMASVFAHAWNRRFETADLIPLYEWDRNYVFIIGEGEEAPDPRFPNEPPRKFPIYIKVPKGDAAAVLTAPAEALLRIATQQGDRSWTEHLFHGVVAATQGLSPVDPSVSGFVSLTGVPTFETAVEIQTNRNLFTGRQIVPESELTRPPEAQFGPETSRTAVLLGEQFGVSPRLIDHAIRGITAGLGQEAVWLADMGLKALGYEPEVPGAGRRQGLTPVEQVAQTPGVSRFLGVRATEPQRVAAERLQRQLEQDRRTLYENPEFRRFGFGVNPVPEAVTVDGEAVRLPPEIRLRRQAEGTRLLKEALDGLIQTDYYRQRDDDGKRALIDAVRTLIQNRTRDAAIAELQGQTGATALFDVQEFIRARQLQEQFEAIPKYVHPRTGQPLSSRDQATIDWFVQRLNQEAGRMRVETQQQLRVLELSPEQNRRIRAEAARRLLQQYPSYRNTIALAANANKLYNPVRRAFWIQHADVLSPYYVEPTIEVPEGTTTEARAS